MQNNTLLKILRAKSVAGQGALEHAKSAYGVSSTVARLIEKDVLGSNLLNDPDYRAAQREFISLVRAKSLVGKVSAISSFKKLPAGTPILKQNTPLMASWAGEGKNIQTTGTDFTRLQNDKFKLGALLPVTNEVLKGIGEDFESALSRDLVSAVAELEGVSFIDPGNAGVTAENPASVLYGINPVSASAAPAVDIKALIKAFTGDLETAVLVCSPEKAVTLHDAGYEGAGARGGEIAGVPLVTSAAAGNTVALIDPSRILLSDDGITMDISKESLVQTGTDSNGEPQYMSLFQQNISAIRAVRYLSWQRVDQSAAAWLSASGW